MSHNAITYSGHQAGVYHASHAFEGGTSNPDNWEWYPDKYNGKIIIEYSDRLELWEAYSDDYIQDILNPYTLKGTICANNDAEKFFVSRTASSGQSSYIYDYDGNIINTFAPYTPNPISWYTPNGTKQANPYLIGPESYPIGNYNIDFLHPNGLFNYDGDAMMNRYISTAWQWIVNSYAKNLFQAYAKKKTIANSNSELGIRDEKFNQSSLISGNMKRPIVNPFSDFNTGFPQDLWRSKYAEFEKYNTNTSTVHYIGGIMDLTTWTTTFSYDVTDKSQIPLFARRGTPPKIGDNSNLFGIWENYLFINYPRLPGTICRISASDIDYSNTKILLNNATGTISKSKTGSDYRFFVCLIVQTLEKWLKYIGNNSEEFYEISNHAGESYSYFLWEYVLAWHIYGDYIWIDYKNPSGRKIYVVDFKTDTLEATITP